MESDLHTLLAAFVGVMIAEVIVKPVAIRSGRAILRYLDEHVSWIPDWLHSESKGPVSGRTGLRDESGLP